MLTRQLLMLTPTCYMLCCSPHHQANIVAAAGDAKKIAKLDETKVKMAANEARVSAVVPIKRAIKVAPSLIAIAIPIPILFVPIPSPIITLSISQSQSLPVIPNHEDSTVAIGGHFVTPFTNEDSTVVVGDNFV